MNPVPFRHQLSPLAMYVMMLLSFHWLHCAADEAETLKSILSNDGATYAYDIFVNMDEADYYGQSSTASYQDTTEPNEYASTGEAHSSSGYPSHEICLPPDVVQESGGNVDLVWAEPATKLLRIIRNPKSYNKFLAPGQLLKETTMVDVAVYIESMGSFRSQGNDFEVDMYLALSWQDNRLKHNCRHPILITDLEYSALLWNPDLYFVNSKFSYMHVVTTPNFMMLIYPDGLIFKSIRVDVTLSCNMRLERFPLDVQECPIQIQSYAYVEQLVNLTWHYNSEAGFPISRNPKIKLNNMNITGTTTTYCTELYPMFRGWGNWSCLRGFIHLQRYVTFHIFQTYVPTAMLVAISWLSFWLDIRASPARISLTITTLLTLTTMGNTVRQDLPQVSYVKAIDIWLSVCTGFVFCVLLEYTLVNYFISQKTTGCKVHTRPQTCTRNGEKANNSFRSSALVIAEYARSCGACVAKWERYAKRVDLISRVAFPMAFMIFVIIYCFLCSRFAHVFDRTSP